MVTLWSSRTHHCSWSLLISTDAGGILTAGLLVHLFAQSKWRICQLGVRILKQIAWERARFQFLSLSKIRRFRITVAGRQELDEVHLVLGPDGGRKGDTAQTTDRSPKKGGDIQKMMLINQNGEGLGFFPIFRGNFKSHC